MEYNRFVAVALSLGASQLHFKRSIKGIKPAEDATEEEKAKLTKWLGYDSTAKKVKEAKAKARKRAKRAKAAKPASK